MVAFDQSRDDRSSERERVSVRSIAFSDETPELVTFWLCIMRGAHAGVATSKNAATWSLVRCSTAN